MTNRVCYLVKGEVWKIGIDLRVGGKRYRDKAIAAGLLYRAITETYGQCLPNTDEFLSTYLKFLLQDTSDEARLIGLERALAGDLDVAKARAVVERILNAIDVVEISLRRRSRI